MQAPIFLSSQQLNALFVDEDMKLSQHVYSAHKYRESTDFVVKAIDDEERQTDYYRMIMIPSEEYYQLKANSQSQEEQLNELRLQVNKLEDVVRSKDEEIRRLQKQSTGSSPTELSTMKLEKHQILQEQNVRLTQQLKELLNKNKELVEEGQSNHDELLNARLSSQTAESKLLNEQKQHKKAVQKYERDILRLQTELLNLKKQYSSQSLVEDTVDLNNIPNFSKSLNDRQSPQHQWKSNIVYGTQSQISTLSQQSGSTLQSNNKVPQPVPAQAFKTQVQSFKQK